MDNGKPILVDNQDEHQWIQQSLAGDRVAFEHLVERYQRMIHALTYRMTGSLADAEDVAQEVFVQAYQQLRSYRGEAKFSSWLYRIGVNRCLNWKKKTVRREQAYEQWGAEQRADDSPANDVAEKVQRALLQLDPKQRSAIILTIYEEMSHAEAARILRCSETTVSWRVFMARKKLKQLLEVRP